MTDRKDMVQSAHQLRRLLRGNMQTNTDHHATTESIHRIHGKAFQKTDSLMRSKLWPSMATGRTASLLVLITAFLCLHSEQAKAFQIKSGLLDVGYWHSLEKEYNPETAATITRLSGNSATFHRYASFVVSPQAGDLQNGTVQLRVGYRATETMQQDLLNFVPAPFDYHYSFSYRTHLQLTTPNLPGPDHPLEETGTDVGYFLLDAPIGVECWLQFLVNINDVREGGQAQDWHPAIIDPTQSGNADLFISGRINLVSMEIVPEPTTAVMTLLGASLLGYTLRRR